MDTHAATTEPTGDVGQAFLADRQAFWAWFTNAVFYGATGIAILLILLAFFLG